MKTIFTLSAAVAALLIHSNNAIARTQSEPDLSAGIAFPSASDSPSLNPAGLAGTEKTLFEAHMRAGSFDQPEGGAALTGSMSRVGLGVQVLKSHGSESYVGIAYPFGKLEAGLALHSDISDILNFGLDAGVRLPMSDSLALAFTVPDIMNLGQHRRWNFGIGVRAANVLTIEHDFHFHHESMGIGFQTVDASAALVFSAARQFSLKLGTHISYVPATDVGGLDLGLQYWVSPKFALYADIERSFSDSIFGLKYSF